MMNKKKSKKRHVKKPKKQIDGKLNDAIDIDNPYFNIGLALSDEYQETNKIECNCNTNTEEINKILKEIEKNLNGALKL